MKVIFFFGVGILLGPGCSHMGKIPVLMLLGVVLVALVLLKSGRARFDLVLLCKLSFLNI